jgi:outer membrane protein assembly factor BamE (lipoprotein component of BamABCDE complex)
MTLTSRILGLAAVLGLVASSCVVVHSDSHTQYSGRHVSDATLEQIKPESSQEYVLTLIGEPTSKSDLTDGSSIWKWSYTKKQTSSGHLILLFSGGSTTETNGAAYVEFTPEGRVRHAWRD